MTRAVSAYRPTFLLASVFNSMDTFLWQTHMEFEFEVGFKVEKGRLNRPWVWVLDTRGMCAEY